MTYADEFTQAEVDSIERLLNWALTSLQSDTLWFYDRPSQADIEAALVAIRRAALLDEDDPVTDYPPPDQPEV